MKQYLDYLDLAKGIGIILVIMGHSLFPLHIAIDIFHMPLFFFISGITLNINNRVSISKRILKKIDRIFIPLIFFTILSGFFEILLKPIGIGNFNDPLWFLKVIFTSIIIYYAILYNFHNYKNLFILTLTLIGLFFAIKNIKLFLDIDLVLVSLSFIHLGYILKNYYKKMKVIQTIYILITSLIIYAIGIYFIIKLDITGAYYYRIYRSSIFLFYITSISGILVALTISKLINKVKLINYLGKYSLIILCVHFPFIQRVNILVSKTDLYHNGVIGKLIIGIFVYTITILFSIICIELFRKFVPKLTGFKSNFIVNL